MQYNESRKNNITQHETIQRYIIIYMYIYTFIHTVHIRNIATSILFTAHFCCWSPRHLLGHVNFGISFGFGVDGLEALALSCLQMLFCGTAVMVQRHLSSSSRQGDWAGPGDGIVGGKDTTTWGLCLFEFWWGFNKFWSFVFYFVVVE